MWQAWVSSQWQQRGLMSWVFRPLSWIYLLAVLMRQALFRRGILQIFKPGIPVVVVGNIYVGGTGKTPVILSLIEALRARGWQPGLVSRGYGAQAGQHPRCGRGFVSARLFGDEPAMITIKTGVAIAVHPDRAQAARALMAFDPKVDVILSDDGLQHWHLGRDVEIVVQDERAIGNGLVLPAGPLRESASRMKQVHAVLTRKPFSDLTATSIVGNIVHADFAFEVDRFRHLQTGREVCPEEFTRIVSVSKDMLAMAGIGVPERFFADLRRLGVHPSRTLPLADHGHFDAAWLSEQSEQTILMTEKDAVRLLTPAPARALTNPSGSTESGIDVIDERIWVGLASSRWTDQEVFDWLDARLQVLHQSP